MREDEVRMPLASFIDIVFLLLIFFLVTSHFDVASGVRIRLPRVASMLYDQKDNRITVLIDSSGQIFLEGKKIELKELGERIKTLVKDKNLVQLVLQADKDAKHGFVVQAMDVAKTAGVQSIVIIHLYQKDKEREARLERIKKLEQQNKALLEEIERIHKDKEYVESLGRRELGLVKEGEILYRFSKENENPVSPAKERTK
jgi:biopolymer transport protein ExbD